MLRDSRGGWMRSNNNCQGNQEEPNRFQGCFQGAKQDSMQKARQVAICMRHMQAQVHRLLFPAAEIRSHDCPKEIRGKAPQLKEGHQLDQGGIRSPGFYNQGGAGNQKVGLCLRKSKQGRNIVADRIPLHIREEGAHIKNGFAICRNIQEEEGQIKRVRLLRQQDRQK